jgi:electron transfer flavoprotein alpha subunit
VSASTKLGSGQTSVALLGNGDLSSQAKSLSVNGVSHIYLVSDVALQQFGAETVVDALEAVSTQSTPDLVLIAGSRRGKEVAARLATRLKFGCVSDALKLGKEGGGVVANRLVWGGNAIATVTSKEKAVVTIPLRANERSSGSSNPEIKKVEFSPKTRGATFIQRKEKSAGQVDIKQAEVVVSAGRGFKKKEDLAILNGLASVLKAVIGGSRPLTSDLGWMPEDRQVGLSGVTVKPKLYVAVGISGQIQHLTGMRDSKIVVAINNDKNAPIFQECDYGIVGDLYQVVPELSKALKAKLGR